MKNRLGTALFRCFSYDQFFPFFIFLSCISVFFLDVERPLLLSRPSVLRVFSHQGGGWILRSPPSAQASHFRFVDFDDTLTESRVSSGGAFKSKFRLFFCETTDYSPASAALQSSFISLPQPPYIDVTSSDLERIREALADEASNTPGDLGRVFTLESGEKIEPGHYSLRFPDSFLYFRDDPSGKRNYLLEDFRAAEALVEGQNDRDRHDSPLTFKGPYWEEFVRAMATPEDAATTMIITSRGHDRYTTWMEFFSYLQSRGYIRYTPKPEHIHGISRQEYSYLGKSQELAKKKTEILRKHLLQAIRISPQRSVDLRRNPDGDGMGLYHLVTIAENEPEILESYWRLLADFARRKVGPFKFQIFNTGIPSLIRKSGRPQWAIVTADGGFRRPQPQENFLETKGTEAPKDRTLSILVPSSFPQSCEETL